MYESTSDDIDKNIVSTDYFDITIGSGGPFVLTPTLSIIPNADQMHFNILYINYYTLVGSTYNLMDNSGDIILVAS
jgi:hypothetical protein